MEEAIVILRADTSVKHGLIVNLLDELRKLENLKIGISTEKKWNCRQNSNLLMLETYYPTQFKTKEFIEKIFKHEKLANRFVDISEN